jgi:hypothetical protein
LTTFLVSKYVSQNFSMFLKENLSFWFVFPSGFSSLFSLGLFVVIFPFCLFSPLSWFGQGFPVRATSSPFFSTLFYSHLFFTVPKDVYDPWQWNAKVRLFLLFPSSLGVTILSMHRRAIYSIFVITDKNCSKTNLFRVTFYIHVELIIWSHHIQ